jgi:NADH-quinone oxidoreductase subunit F
MTARATAGWDKPLTRAMRSDGRPASMEDYRACGGYEGIERALSDMRPAEVTSLVTASGLRGRGGAGYSTGRKWSTMPLGADAPHPKYIVCNADEMEPGSFKDRYLMERNPHLLLEGMLLAGYACEADTGYIFVRDQYDAPWASLERAIEEATAAGVLGRGVLGSGFDFHVDLHRSVGRYICGEASALLNALEGQRPNPRARPPHMTGAGLFARPTVVNNVETLGAVPAIVRNGLEWWQGLADKDGGGTKVFGVAGRVARPGCYELPMGTPLRDLIEIHGGGMLPGYRLRALLPGGASTSFVTAADLDVTLDFESLPAVGSRLGTGTVVVLDDATCPVGMTLNLVRFFAQESCGWCTPCREGLQWTAALLSDIEAGAGRPDDLDLLAEHIWVMGSDKTFCDLAPGAMQPVESALLHFGDDFARHIAERRCPYDRGDARLVETDASGAAAAAPPGAHP